MSKLQQRIRSATDTGHDKFFRTRLLNSTPDQISEMIDNMDLEVDNLRKESLKMSWYMRGGVSYEQALQMSMKERRMIGDIIKDNLETTKKTKMPFF